MYIFYHEKSIFIFSECRFNDRGFGFYSNNICNIQRIPYQNRRCRGDRALLSCAFGVRTFSVTVATSGITLTATKACPENNRDNRRKNREHLFFVCLVFRHYRILYTVFNAKFIGCRFLHDKRTVLPLTAAVTQHAVYCNVIGYKRLFYRYALRYESFGYTSF